MMNHEHPNYPHVLAVSTRRGRLNALVDRRGELILAPAPLQFLPFEPDGRGGFIAAVGDENGRWGYMNHEGRWLIDPVFDDARTFTADGLARCRRDGRWGYVDRAGQLVIAPVYAEARPFDGGLAAVKTEEDAAFGYIDVHGAQVIGPRFADALPFSAGLAAVRPQAGGLCGYIDTAGTLVIGARFRKARSFCVEGSAPVAFNNDEWGLIDRNGEPLGRQTYSFLGAFNEIGLAEFSPHDSSPHGYLDHTGRIVKEGRVSDVCASGLIKEGDFGNFFDRTGRTVLQGFDWAADFDDCGSTLAFRRTWLILRADGGTFPTPGLEPVLDGLDVIGFSRGNALAPFLNRDGDEVHLNPCGDTVATVRVAAPGVVRLLDAAGRAVWEGEADPDAPAKLFFDPPPAAFFSYGYEYGQDIVPVALKLLRGRLRRFHPYSLGFNQNTDVYDLEAQDMDPSEAHRGAMKVLAGAYLSESQTRYFFLIEERIAVFKTCFEALLQRLTEHFGEPSREDRFTLEHDYTPRVATWSSEGRYLTLQLFFGTGDGDWEGQIWLAARPVADVDG